MKFQIPMFISAGVLLASFATFSATMTHERAGATVSGWIDFLDSRGDAEAPAERTPGSPAESSTPLVAGKIPLLIDREPISSLTVPLLTDGPPASALRVPLLTHTPGAPAYKVPLLTERLSSSGLNVPLLIEKAHASNHHRVPLLLDRAPVSPRSVPLL